MRMRVVSARARWAMRSKTWEELRSNVLEAVSLHFEDAQTRPRLVQMHYVKGRVDSVGSSMKLPRGVSGDRLIHLLTGLGYAVFRQKGSHIRLRHEGPPAAR
jgi:hypothetical protein